MPRWNDEQTIYLSGEEIRERRKTLGLSQKKLAELLGSYQSNVARWELGKAIVSKVMADYIKSVFEGLKGGEEAENKKAA